MSALDRLAERMFGRQRLETTAAMASVDTQTYIGVAASDSADGSVSVVLSDDVTQPDNGIWDGDTFLASDELGTSVELPTTTAVREGDRVLVTASGANVLTAPVVTGVVGRGDEQQAQIDAAAEAAASVEGIAQEALDDVEQVRQDVADFRSDVATTYATKVERQDGDDAVKTFITTNYTNTNDLATTYATKTLLSQTKDAIELAASQTYETQTDAAATYATKSALTVGLDGIRSEVAEDYQPKGDYATTASMNSAIQQSASSIESSVAATYETKSDAAATYATKTDVTQTVSGLDTRITTAQSTADGAASTASTAAGNAATALSTANTANGNATAALNKVDGLKVGGTNLILDSANRSASGLGSAAGSRKEYQTIDVGQSYMDVAHGTQVTISFDLYMTVNTANPSLQVYNTNNKCPKAFSNSPTGTGVAPGVWLYFTAAAGSVIDKRVSVTGYINDRTSPSMTTNVLEFYSVYGTSNWYSIHNLKLELGNVPTDWSPAPEDMATETDLQAEVTERQTLIRQFSGGVLAGYVGNAIAALVNAAGSFDVVRTAWSGGVPSILGTLATFGSNLIRIGEETGQNVLITSAGQFFRKGLNNLLAIVAGSSGHTYSFTIEDGVYSYPLPFGESIAGDPTISVGGHTLPWSDCQLQFNYENAGYSLLFSGDFDPATYAGQTATMTYNTSSSLSVFDGLGTAAQNIISFFDARGITLLGGRGVIQGNTSKQVGSAITEGGAVVGHNVMDVNVIRLANSSPDPDDAYAYLAIRANETYVANADGEKVEGDVDYWRSGVQLVSQDDFGKVSVGLAAGMVGLQGDYLALSTSDTSTSDSFPMQQAINALNCRSNSLGWVNYDQYAASERLLTIGARVDNASSVANGHNVGLYVNTGGMNVYDAGANRAYWTLGLHTARIEFWPGTKVMTVNGSSFTLFTKAQLQAIVGTSWTPTGTNCSVFVMNGDHGVSDAMMSASIDASSVVRVHMNKTRNGALRINYLIIRFA